MEVDVMFSLFVNSGVKSGRILARADHKVVYMWVMRNENVHLSSLFEIENVSVSFKWSWPLPNECLFFLSLLFHILSKMYQNHIGFLSVNCYPKYLPVQGSFGVRLPFGKSEIHTSKAWTSIKHSLRLFSCRGLMNLCDEDIEYCVSVRVCVMCVCVWRLCL